MLLADVCKKILYDQVLFVSTKKGRKSNSEKAKKEILFSNEQTLKCIICLILDNEDGLTKFSFFC